jgi:hypothetical protein
MSEDTNSQKIEGHVFDSDGNPIGANLVLRRIEVDTEPCLGVSGVDWFGDRPGGLINRADDVQFCVPRSALAEPGVWTVVGIYADASETYDDRADPQPQRWADVVRADSPAEAIESARAAVQVEGAEVVAAACLAGNVQVVA